MLSNESIFMRRRQAALDEIDSLGYFTSIRWIDQTDSTNRQLADEIRSGAVQSPAILIADRQSGGKGRGGNQWFSPTGCLMFTFAIPLDRKPTNPRSYASQDIASEPNHLLPLEVGVAVAQSLAPMIQYRPQVKWPNDVYVQDRKICGILIEVVQASLNTLSNPIAFNGGGRTSQATESIAIIGIGINCQVDFSQAGLDVQQRATSVHLVSNSPPSECSPEDVLVQFLQTWQTISEERESNPDWLLECWKDWSFLEGKWVTIERATTAGSNDIGSSPNATTEINRAIEGLCLGIDGTGALLIATADGRVAPIIAGTVAKYKYA